MTNRHLVAPGDALGKVGQILKAQVVACVESQTDAARSLGSLDIGGNSRLTIGSIACGVGLGLEFHTLCFALHGRLDHLHLRVNEDRGTDAGIVEA